MKGKWEHFTHDADMGVRGYGATREEAFEQAAVALTAIITEPTEIRLHTSVEVRCEAPDDELLLAEWLNALIYEMAVRHMLFGRFQVRIEKERLSGTAWGEEVEVARHRPAVEVKGATYTAVRVACEDGRWVAQTVVDV